MVLYSDMIVLKDTAMRDHVLKNQISWHKVLHFSEMKEIENEILL